MFQSIIAVFVIAFAAGLGKVISDYFTQGHPEYPREHPRVVATSKTYERKYRRYSDGREETIERYTELNAVRQPDGTIITLGEHPQEKKYLSLHEDK